MLRAMMDKMMRVEILRRSTLCRHLAQPATFLWRLRHVPKLPLAFRDVRRARTLDSSRDLVGLAFDGCGRIIAPLQVRAEAEQLYARVSGLKPRVVVEIGTARGGTLFLLCHAAAHDATIVSIDLPGGWFGGGYPRWKQRLYREFALPTQTLHLLRANSHEEQTLGMLREILRDQEIDFLFIDGDHRYLGVKKDFDVYGPLVRHGGVIGFHDIVPNVQYPDCGVDRFWSEVKADYPHEELVQSWDQVGCGIGILRV